MGPRLKRLPLSSRENRTAARMPIDPRLRGECEALRLIYTERRLRMRVCVYTEKRKNPSRGREI